MTPGAVAPGVVAAVVAAYAAALLAVAWWADRRAAAGRSVVARPGVYALSLAVYCTAWTFYGSVGLAAEAGVAFLPVYLGPTLAALLWGVVVRKLVRVCRAQGLTSVADVAAARYGASGRLGALVAVVALVGVVPYVALQLRAISATVGVLTGAPVRPERVLADPALWAAVGLAAFTVAFGARHLDAARRREGLVAAVAAESVVKLVAFLAVGVFVTFGLFDGVGALVREAAARPDVAALFALPESPGVYAGFLAVTVVSALAVVLLPRQFHVAVVEATDERHLDRAVWQFPAYLFAINLFVLPIALAGRLRLPPGADADLFVLTLPLAAGHEALALLGFVGGLSAGTGMVVVAATALATMVSNHLVAPLLVRARPAGSAGLPGRLLAARRAAVGLVLAAGYGYARALGDDVGLVSIGLVSFAAVAQVAPAVLGGLYWAGGTRAGALAGLAAGAAVWAYTLLLPTLAGTALVPASLLADGPGGVAWLRPQALFGLGGLDPLAQSLVWSGLANVGLYVGVSVFGRARAGERAQAEAFVRGGLAAGRGGARRADVRAMLRRYLGPARAAEALADAPPEAVAEGRADAALVRRAEALLAGAVGPTSARVAVEHLVRTEPVPLAEVLDVLDEAQAAREAQAALAEANARLEELDRLRESFVSTVSHELRTPLTAIRAFAEILAAHPDLPPERRAEFLGVVTRESERLTRLIDGLLTLSRPDAEARRERVCLAAVAAEAARLVAPEAEAAGLTVEVCGAPAAPVHGDTDALLQATLNLLSNARKYARARVRVSVEPRGGRARLAVEDDGPGVHPADRARIFEPFAQAAHGARAPGTGLGLAIVRRIARAHGGDVAVEDAPAGGARLVLDLPGEGGGDKR